MAQQIIQLVGGKENISYCAHCATRLRLNINNKDIVSLEDIKKVEGVMGTQWSGEQLQIIIGQTVRNLYVEVCKIGGFEETVIKKSFPVMEVKWINIFYQNSIIL